MRKKPINKAKKPKAKKQSQQPTSRALLPEPLPPVLSCAESGAQIREILDRLFDGNAEAIVKSLAHSGELTPEEMARMKQVFAKSKKGKKK